MQDVQYAGTWIRAQTQNADHSKGIFIPQAPLVERKKDGGKAYGSLDCGDYIYTL